MFFLLIIALFFFLLFIPIPLKLSIDYWEDFYEIRFYKIKLLSSNGGIIDNYLHKKDSEKKEDEHSELTDQKERLIKQKKERRRKKRGKLSLKVLYDNLSTNKFKPYFSISSNIKFSTDDAANTAILYGTLNTLNPLMYKIFSIIFKIRHYDNEFVPTFENKSSINLSIACIFTLNIAKIIYMLFLIKKSTIPIRGGAQ